ncbi:hypothetical protein FOMPIDRAFT_91439, partial [Fomitopsis schrenkii]
GKEDPVLSAKQEKHLAQDILTGHRTVSAGTTLPREHALKQVYLPEQSHVRMVFKLVGTPLSKFKDTKEQAYERGIIHRNISERNVMICRDPGSLFKGFIHDFAYGFSWLRFLGHHEWVAELARWLQYCAEHGHEPIGPDTSEVLKDCKEQVGTPWFMAVQILQGKMTHEARHDLESFFWLLLYIVLRHTDHSLSSNPDVFRSIFQDVDEICHGLLVSKREFLVSHAPVWIEGNEGLSYILREFHALCKRNFTEGRAPVVRPVMTHHEVLLIFDRALNMQWPTANDGP